MLNTNLSWQSLSALSNINDAYKCSVGSFVKVITSYLELFYGLCILWKRVHCASLKKSMYLPKKVCRDEVHTTYYTNVVSNRMSPICKHVPPFVIMSSRRFRGMGEGNRFSWPTFRCIFGPCILCNICPFLQ